MPHVDGVHVLKLDQRASQLRACCPVFCRTTGARDPAGVVLSWISRVFSAERAEQDPVTSVGLYQVSMSITIIIVACCNGGEMLTR